MHVRNDGQFQLFADFRQDAAAFPYAGSAEGRDGSSVRLVVGGLENQRDVQVFRNGLDGAGHLPDEGFAFQRAGAQEVERPRAADFNGLNVKRHKTKPVCPYIMTVSSPPVKPLSCLRREIRQEGTIFSGPFL